MLGLVAEGDVSIRARRDTDLEACLALLRLVHEHDSYPVIWPDDAAGWVSGRGALAAWVAERAGAVVGQVSLRPPAGAPVPTWEAGTGLPSARLGVVSRLFVDPGHRRTGTGRTLLRGCGRRGPATEPAARARRPHPQWSVDRVDFRQIVSLGMGA
jgi:GNAT superfamily N-acetyltransferase